MQQSIHLDTSHRIETSEGARWSVNLLRVLGTMCTGGGSAQLSSCLATIGIHSMSKATFTATERIIGDVMKADLTIKILEAGKVECELAIGRDEWHQGVPAITVIADGGLKKGVTNILTMPKVGHCHLLTTNKETTILSSMEQVLFSLYHCH